MGVWDNLQLPEETITPQPAVSKVEEFKKVQIDNTKVGKAEQAILPAVAGAIEKSKGIPVLGKLVNPALNVMEGLNKYVIQPITQGVSTGLLTPQALAQGKGTQSFRFAREQSKKISMGQAVATSVGQVAGLVLPDSLSPTFMDTNFNVFDETQRNQAYRNEFIGIIASGSTDLALAVVGTKGAGALVRSGTKQIIGPKVINTVQDMQSFKGNVDNVVAWADKADGTAPPTGLAVLIDDAVKQTNYTKLASNPLVQNTANPTRTATILSHLDNHRDVGDYLLAERGDAGAFARFMERRPVEADHIDDYGLNKIDPIQDFNNLGYDTLSPKLTERYQKIIEAKKNTDKRFAYALDDFMSKMVGANTFESYQPGRIASLEKLTLGKNKLQSQAQYGDIKLFGEDGNAGWRSEIYQSKTYDRAVRFIAWTGSGRPQGYINISNPRKFESANDLLSDLNRLQMLRGAEGSAFKRAMVRQYMSAQDNTQRAMALATIEQQVMIKIAKYYGVRGVDDVTSNKEAVELIRKWHAQKSQHRQTVLEYANKNKVIPASKIDDDGKLSFIPDEDGNLNITNIRSITTEANTIPMLDFRKLEIEVIQNAKRLLGNRAPITKGQVVGSYVSSGMMNVGAFLDTANMVFNNLNLLRFAYIPKNSGVDPLARGSMALESMELIRNAAPGMRNLAHNQSLRNKRAAKYVPGTVKYRNRKEEKFVLKEMDSIAGELKAVVPKWEKAREDLAEAEASWQASRTAASKAASDAKKATKSKQADADALKHQAEYQMFEAQKAFQKASDDLDLYGGAVQSLSNIIEKNRAKISQNAIDEGALLQRKHLGQDLEKVIVNGKEYTFQGLADPNVRGASPFMAEVDTATNWLAANTQSQISRNLSATTNMFVKIKRNEGVPYWNAIAHIANRQIRQELDMPLGMMLRNESDADIVAWLYKGDAGKEYRRRMESLAGRDLTRDELFGWVTQTKNYMFKLLPDKELRDVVLQRNISVKEVETLLRNKTDLLEEIDGPNIALNDLNKWERGLVRVGQVQDAAWRVLAATETRMVRNPLFLSYAREEMRTLISAAQRSGIDPSDVVVNNQYRQIAYRNALQRVEQTLYSSRRLTNGMYAARFAMSFPLAFFNSQTVALRLMAKNPANAYWYSEIADALANYEPYSDEDGNTYKSLNEVPAGTKVSISAPIAFGQKLPSWAKDALKPYLDPRGGGLKWNPKQMEFMVADPSVSWFGTVGISDLVKNGFTAPGSLWSMHGEDIAANLRSTFGDDFYENSILFGGYPQEGNGIISTAFNTIAPGYLRSITDRLGIFRSDRFADEVFSNWKTSYSEWDRGGRVGEPPSMETAAKAAGNMSFIRATVQFFAPISTTFDPVTRAATEYYSKLLKENNGDYDLAQKKMEEEWGIDSLALIGSNQNNIAGVAANYSDIKMIRNNPELLQKIGRWDTKYAAMLSTGYGELTDQYSTEIAAIYKRLNFPGGFESPLTSKKSAEEVRASVESRRGWAEYQKAVDWRNAKMYEYAIRSPQEVLYQSTGIKKEFDSMVKEIANDFKAWGAEYGQGRQDFWRTLVPAIKEVTSDPNWMAHSAKISKANGKADKWDEIAHWTTQAEEFKLQYDRAMNSEQRKNDLKTAFSQFHYSFLQEASDEFSIFAGRYLDNVPELTTELVVP